jgi:hypothetical protein
VLYIDDAKVVDETETLCPYAACAPVRPSVGNIDRCRRSSLLVCGRLADEDTVPILGRRSWAGSVPKNFAK